MNNIEETTLIPLDKLIFQLNRQGCSCLTKTPEIKYHQMTCSYRIAQEVIFRLEKHKN